MDSCKLLISKKITAGHIYHLETPDFSPGPGLNTHPIYHLSRTSHLKRSAKSPVWQKTSCKLLIFKKITAAHIYHLETPDFSPGLGQNTHPIYHLSRTSHLKIKIPPLIPVSEIPKFVKQSTIKKIN